VLSGCSAQGDQSQPLPTANTSSWKIYTNEPGKFSLLMPGIPTESTSTQETDLGQMTAHDFVLKAQQEGHTAAYLISYSDYPAGSIAKMDVNRLLENMWESGYKNLGDRLFYKKAAPWNNLPCIEFQYRGSGNSKFMITARMLFVQDRNFLLSTVMLPNQASEGYALKYLNSFQPSK
jgi:hypothetical protein